VAILIEANKGRTRLSGGKCMAIQVVPIGNSVRIEITDGDSLLLISLRLPCVPYSMLAD
jgi:hypothetical protein